MESVIGKREQNKRKRREAIVEIAARSFFDRGYAATSMSAISDEMGGSKATLWSHFGSKEELFAAVIDEQVARFAHVIEASLNEDRFSLEGLRRYCRSFLDKLMSEEGIQLARLIMADGGRFPEINKVFHVRGPARIQRHLADYFALQFSTEEAASLARITNAAMVGYRSHALTRPELPRRAEMEQFVDDFIAHLRLPAYAPAPEGEDG